LYCWPYSSSDSLISTNRSGSTLNAMWWTLPIWLRSGCRLDPRSGLTKNVTMRPSPASKNRWVDSVSSRFGWRNTSGIPSTSR